MRVGIANQMELDPESYPSGDISSWNMTIPSHEEYMTVSHSFADQLICHPLTNSTIAIVEVAGQRIHDLASYCNRLKAEYMRLDKRLNNVRCALEGRIDLDTLHST